MLKPEIYIEIILCKFKCFAKNSTKFIKIFENSSIFIKNFQNIEKICLKIVIFPAF